MSNEPTVKRWTAKRKAAVVMDIFKGKGKAAEVARHYDLTISQVEGWIDEAQRRMENRFKACPKDICEQYKSELRETKEALVEEGHVVSLVKLCRWLGLHRRTLYYRPKPRRRIINTELASRVKLALERFPTYDYRRLACVLGENRKPIRRILQLKDRQIRTRPQGFRPRAKSLPSVALCPDERWATPDC